MDLILKIIKEFYVLIIMFLAVLFTFFLFINFDKNEKIKLYEENITQSFKREYNSIYENIKILSQNSFYGIINKPKIVNLIKESYNKDEKTKSIYRQKLFDILKIDYERLKTFSFLQLHFHYPNNKSFLRLHSPKFYGDDLTNYRQSVVQVNNNFKPIDGFEIGRVFDGFRFVYPLNDENLKHVGSVEISISNKYFEDYFQKSFSTDLHFLIRKDLAKNKMLNEIFQNYHTSNENDEYIFKEFGEHTHYVTNNFMSKDELEDIKKSMKAGSTFDIVKKYEGNYYLTIFLPIENIKGISNAAYLVLSLKSEYLEKVYFDFYKRVWVIFAFMIIFIVYLYVRYKQIEKYKYNEMLLTEQSKMASIGEMIENISHQWRQPLSVISVSASGLKLNHEYKMLTDEDLKTNLDNIIKFTQYLSNTIEDFRNYFNEKHEKKKFFIKDLIENSLVIFRNDFERNNTKVIIESENIEVVSYESQLKHVLIILLKNINDLEKKNRVVFFKTYKEKDFLVIEVQDNCGGIPEKIIKKIFEPYFTTKHKSMGSGLGLFIAYEIVNKTCLGSITAENRYFDYQFKKEYGACFTIKIPLDNQGI